MNQNGLMSSPAAFLRILLLATLCAGCGDKPQAPPEARLVNVVRVTIGSTNNDVGYSGEVRPRYETNLSFRLAGKIVARNVEIGGLVKKGDVLARLDPEDQQLNARSAQSQLAAAKSEYEQSKAELQRYTDLYKKGFISKAEFDRWQNSFNVAKARLEQAQAQLAVTRNQTGYTELAADHVGVVTAILIEVGQVVAAGQTVMKLARTDDREIVISIPENKLSELSAAREIAISLWAEPLKIYKGKVREVSPSADPVTRTYAAKISVLDADPAMKLGMTANVYLRGQMHLYLNYAREHWTNEGENPPVGLILCAQKDDAVARYALEGLPNKVVAREYLTALPNEKVLVDEIEKTRKRLESGPMGA